MGVSDPQHAPRGANLVAGLWGLAEATLFFIVPDVWLSYLALRGMRRALTACLYATAGALIGGAVMYGWGATDLGGAMDMIDRVPAISGDMLERVGADLDTGGLTALFVGPFIGTPYKIYAARAASADIHILPFLLVSVPARLIRFVLVSAIVGAISSRLLGRWPFQQRLRLLAAFWILFYALFLSLMPA